MSQNMSIMPDEDKVNLFLKNKLINNKHKDEIKEFNKHEVIVKIAEILGDCPSNISKSEEIFDSMRFCIANYVVNHDFDSQKNSHSDIVLWLDEKTNPNVCKKLNNFINKYFSRLE